MRFQTYRTADHQKRDANLGQPGTLKLVGRATRPLNVALAPGGLLGTLVQGLGCCPLFSALWAVLIDVVADGLRVSLSVAENQSHLVVEHVSGAAVQADNVLMGSIPDNL